MQFNLKFMVIGEVYTDLHINLRKDGRNILRLGGVFHSARTFDALCQNYTIASLAPSYLRGSIEKFSQELSANTCYHIGKIENCPNIMLISDSVEAGNQNYNDILRDQSVASIDIEELHKAINQYAPTDVIIYPGKYQLGPLFEVLGNYRLRLHIDFQYGIVDVDSFDLHGIKIETFIVSTSAQFFKDNCLEDVSLLSKQVDTIQASSILLKENRGGSRLFLSSDSKWVSAPAFPVKTEHSVGVGDCYNALFLCARYAHGNIEYALRQASYAAALYASTWDHNQFKLLMDFFPNEDELMSLKGVELPWEERSKSHIYIAAPDFPNVDTSWIDKLCEALEYHNFCPRRPVKENGLIKGNEPEPQQLEAYNNDIKLLEECALLIAVLLYDDPGTYVEIGWMAKSGKPTILFDPYGKATNLFLKKTVTRICNTLGEVVDTVYQIITKRDEIIEKE